MQETRCLVFKYKHAKDVTSPTFRGTSALCHHSCIKEWIQSSRWKSCEVCRTPFTIEYQKYNLTTYLQHKRTATERKDLKRDFIYFLLLTPASVAAVVLCLAPLIRALWRWDFEGQEYSYFLAPCSIIVIVCYVAWLKNTLQYNYWNFLDFEIYFGTPRVDRVVPLNYITNHPKSKNHQFKITVNEANDRIGDNLLFSELQRQEDELKANCPQANPATFGTGSPIRYDPTFDMYP
uniref:RING-CH-type domain-containing protein n=1 Tax=Panagrellus redivivus TaxID=6233 RepID=A0A7E4WDG3_PANRE